MTQINLRFSAIVLLAAALTAIGARPAAADGIAYVDARRLIEQSPQGLDIARELEAEFAERSRELKGRLDGLQARQAEFEKNSVLITNPEERREKTQELLAMERQLVRAQREYQEDVARRRDQRISKLEKEITEVIIAVAKKEKLDLVIQQAVYINPDIDFTDRVLKSLEKRHKK